MKKENIIVLISACTKIIDIFLGPFLVAYFIKASVDSMVSLSVFKVLNYVFLAFFAMFAGLLMEKNHALATFRIGIFTRFLYVLLIIILNEDIVNHLGLIALFYGFSTGTFWLPFNIYQVICADNDGRTRFEVKKMAINNVLGVLMPVWLGAMITVTNYQITAVIILVISMVQFISSFYIKQIPTDKERYNLLECGKKFIKNSQIRKIFASEFLKGLTVSDSVLDVLVVILIISFFKTDMNLGIINSACAIITVIVCFFYSKYFKGKNDKMIILVSVILPALALGLFMMHASNVTIIIYNVLYSVLVVGLFHLISNVRLCNLSAREVSSEDTTEFWIVREVLLNIGRVLGFILMFIIGLLGAGYLNILLFILGVILVLHGILVIKIDKYEQ